MTQRNSNLICVYLCSSAALLSSLSCKSPSKANVELRKQNQALLDEIESLKRKSVADSATISALESQREPVQSLSKEQLDRLYTVAGIEFGRLTGIAAAQLRIQVTPTDTQGQQLKAAGTFHIIAIDDSSSEPRTIGEWKFDLEQSRAAWLGQAFQYAYVFNVPFQDRPANGIVQLKVNFKDELTGREVSATREIKISN